MQGLKRHAPDDASIPVKRFKKLAPRGVKHKFETEVISEDAKKAKKIADGHDEKCPPPLCTDVMNKVGLAVMNSLLKRRTEYGEHASSYERFMRTTLVKIIMNTMPLWVEHIGRGVIHKIDLSNIHIERPMVQESNGVLHPLESLSTHIRRITLMGTVLGDMEHSLYHLDSEADPVTGKRKATLVERTVFESTTLFQMPMMDGTVGVHDWNDFDAHKHRQFQGTFSINGHRRSGITQQDRVSNYTFVFSGSKSSKFIFTAELRCKHPHKLRTTATLRIQVERTKKGVIPGMFIKLPYLKHMLPITVFFRLHGAKTISEMVEVIVGRERMRKMDSRAFMVRSILFGCVGVTDPECDALKATERELLIWVARHCGGEDATGAVSTRGQRTPEQLSTSMMYFMSNECMPQAVFVGEDSNSAEVRARKLMCVGLSIHKLIKVYLGEQKPDMIDNGMYRRYITIGDKIALKVRQLWRNWVIGLRAAITRVTEQGNYVNPPDMTKEVSNALTRTLRKCLAKGDFSVDPSDNSTQTGITQVVNHTNQFSRLDIMTTIDTPLNRDTTLSTPRELQSTTSMVLDPVNTPDTRAIGLTVRRCLGVIFRAGHSVTHLMAALRASASDAFDPLMTPPHIAPVVIMINGVTTARTRNGYDLLERFKEARRITVIPPDVSLYFDEDLNQLLVLGDEGAALRCVFIVKNLDRAQMVFARYGRDNPTLLLPQMLLEGAVQWMAKEEERDARVATTYAEVLTEADSDEPFTHLELEASAAMFGATAACLPFINHNQGPRAIYAAGMVKQAIGAQTPTYARAQRDTQSHILMYPQRQMVQTDVARMLETEKEPCTQIFMVALMQFEGLNQEDAVVFNEASCQRGLGSTIKDVVLRCTVRSRGSDTEVICDPRTRDNVRRKKRGSAHALDPKTGMPVKGQVVNNGDLVIGKVLEHEMMFKERDGSIVTQKLITDCSTVYMGNEPMKISRIEPTSKCGQIIVVVTLSEMHELEEGDKVSSESAQKAIASRKARPEDMPFMSDGTVPDMIVAAHGFTSRMTKAQQLEMLGNKIAAVSGTIGDSTPFRNLRLSDMLQSLRDAVSGNGKIHGSASMSVSGCGWENMTCGKSGRPIGRAFIAPCSMYVLRHQVTSKIQARARGPVSALTRQPIESKARNKPMRIGPMESSLVHCIGASHTLQRMLLKNSDGFDVALCRKCGSVAREPQPDKEFRVAALEAPECPRCKTDENVVRSEVPYAMLLLKMELAAAGIDMALLPEGDIPDIREHV
jgi:DNA-directed RNA polymerase II subunit RPB2